MRKRMPAMAQEQSDSASRFAWRSAPRAGSALIALVQRLAQVPERSCPAFVVESSSGDPSQNMGEP